MNIRIFLVTLLLMTIGCSIQQENPLLQKWDTPFQTPPFDEIKNEHFMPAFLEGMKAEIAEVEAIINNEEAPTFKNTIEALEKSGALLERVSRVFNCLKYANTNDELQVVSKEVQPLKTRHNNDINLNSELFAKINQIYAKRVDLGLTAEQAFLLENYYLKFVRKGANLSDEDKEKLRNITEELSGLQVKFGQNRLQQTNAIGLIIDQEADLAGLPDGVIQAAAEMATARGLEGKWAFTLQRSSFTPVLVYSEKRDLRENVFNAFINRCNNNDDYDNKQVVSRIASLRVSRANLLGYKSHADYILERNMAKNQENVYSFLMDLWEPALKRAKIELEEMQTLIDKEGHNFKLQAWDWWYYANKVKKEKYALDDALLPPYFKMENVRAGAFDVAEKLYGIKFIRRNDIQVYHPDVEVFEVLEADGTHLGVFYSDYYPREGKGGGAWAPILRRQSNIEGNFITPLVLNVGNFAKPTVDKPSLMTIGQVETLFHEFGHGLNFLFLNTTYSGYGRVPIDFVELPSQIMENWAMDSAVLKTYALHYKSGESMPQELIDKIENARLFNQGFQSVRLLAAAFLDMDWHTITDTAKRDVTIFELESMARIGLIPEIEPKHHSPNFSHIFAGSYSSGYYSYVWAAVLDADAFQAFKETDLFNKELAASFRHNLLSMGSNDMMAQYLKFRGSKPTVNALLKERGLDQ